MQNIPSSKLVAIKFGFRKTFLIDLILNNLIDLGPDLELGPKMVKNQTCQPPVTTSGTDNFASFDHAIAYYNDLSMNINGLWDTVINI